MKILGFVMTALFFSSLATAQTSSLKLMPEPAKAQIGSGQLVVDQLFSVAHTGAKDERLDRGVTRFLNQLSRETGMPLLGGLADPAKATLVIRTESSGKKIQDLDEDESYALEITSTRATLTAPN